MNVLALAIRIFQTSVFHVSLNRMGVLIPAIKGRGNDKQHQSSLCCYHWVRLREKMQYKKMLLSHCFYRSLKAISKDFPNIQLASKHCFLLEDPPTANDPLVCKRCWIIVGFFRIFRTYDQKASASSEGDRNTGTAVKLEVGTAVEMRADTAAELHIACTITELGAGTAAKLHIAGTVIGLVA
ncbi:hypothetical protein MRB53_031120 [Persea americana]|uniref:Uncharacterized protein n=1 Tax=Persea americana TaxID=3435 RepID=A0ACC2KN91_PERAE|nr:hypothetical protein MRB53_031120 [Persea americana]